MPLELGGDPVWESAGNLWQTLKKDLRQNGYGSNMLMLLYLVTTEVECEGDERKFKKLKGHGTKVKEIKGNQKKPKEIKGSQKN